jgi:hypothetical protein
MHTNLETAFLRKAHALFADSLHRLDARIAARLRESREQALEYATRHKSWLPRAWALPAGAMAAVLAAVAGGILWWNLNSQPALPFAVTNNEDMSIVLGNDNLDMYADLDFYRWLQAQQQAKSSSGDSGDNSSG